MDLRHRSNHELLVDVGNLVGSHRELTAKLVAYLAEIEERRLHLEAGFPSMFEFCVRQLHLSEGEAFRRILAARLFRRFTVVYSLLASGRVHLSTLELLREHLTQENHAELFEAASGKTKREVEAILAARFPKADVPSRITRARIEPLSPARLKVEFTSSAELREKLELCRDLMSHANPSRDLGVVVERAVDLLLADLKKKSLRQTTRPRTRLVTRRAKSGHIASATRRQVYDRDGIQCTYVSTDGRRCEARCFLELDHAEPRALGGGDEPDNLRIRCRAHNQLWAEQVFGRDHVNRSRSLRQKKRRPECRGSAEVRTEPGAPASPLEKVHLVLKNLGFPEFQARRAVAEVAKMHEVAPTVEQALREALFVATAG
jgi:5-methylcytosine-specific restriction endonuclease McrA